jgi:gliding motility-associated lipoprotein GldB
LGFKNAQPSELPKLKQAYPFMFSERIPDSLWVMRMNDTLQQLLASEVEKTFNNFQSVEDDIEGLFQHLKYYDKTFKEPRIITVTSDVDYRSKTIVTDTIVIIALDTYLGANHEFYVDIPKYITQNMEKSQVVSDLATNYSDKYIFQSQRKTLLDEMIYFGKQLYFKDKMIPFKTDAEKIGYTQSQLDWSIANESYIWQYFVERELLFSTDSSLPARFLASAPFSKFYLELDNESPGRLGQYIGWQIVKAYMENNDVSLMDMLQKDAAEIFNNSKFKPRK